MRLVARDISPNRGGVVIGRNEGPRLEACLRSLLGQLASVVYVDSGSSDDSLAIARALNVEIVELDKSEPFTAARARNAGFDRLTELHHDLTFVQFVDGDCIVAKAWVGEAHVFMEKHQKVAVVCGRLRERYADHSVYNKLCDVEWDIPIGEVDACGGIAMVRADAFLAASGFRPDMIAGEEPELCMRLRAEGWKIWRIDTEMASHDAAMTRFGQWWWRSVRTGYGYALGASLRGKPPERLWVRQQQRAVFWSVALPIAVLAGSFFHPVALMLLVLYPLQLMRTAFRMRKLGAFSLVYAAFMTIGKFAEMAGIFRFGVDRMSGRHSTGVEYKADTPSDDKPETFP